MRVWFAVPIGVLVLAGCSSAGPASSQTTAAGSGDACAAPVVVLSQLEAKAGEALDVKIENVGECNDQGETPSHRAMGALTWRQAGSAVQELASVPYDQGDVVTVTVTVPSQATPGTADVIYNGTTTAVLTVSP